MNVLFVCARNVARGPMAAAILRELAGDGSRHSARSAGIAPDAPRPLTTRELAWADLVAVMKDRHLELIWTYWRGHAGKVVVPGVGAGSRVLVVRPRSDVDISAGPGSRRGSP